MAREGEFTFPCGDDQRGDVVFRARAIDEVDLVVDDAVVLEHFGETSKRPSMERLEKSLRTRTCALAVQTSNLRIAAPACLGQRWSTAAGASVDRRPAGPCSTSAI